MSVKINTTIVRPLVPVHETGKVLVFLDTAVQTVTTAETTTAVAGLSKININTIEELLENFKVVKEDVEEEIDGINHELAAQNELYQIEYLLSQGINTIVVSNALKAGVTEAQLEELLGDQEDLGYNFAVGVKLHTNATILSGVTKAVKDFLFSKDIEVLTYVIQDSDYETYIKNINYLDSPAEYAKLSVSLNSILPNIISNYPLIPTDFSNNFHGVLPSYVTAVRKSRNFINGNPHLPVAGENTGLVPEAVRVHKYITTSIKEIAQAKGINVLVNKRGLGAYITAQNTMYPYWLAIPNWNKTTMVDTNGVIKKSTPGYREAARNPLIRSHVVTQALWLKPTIKTIADKMLFQVNNEKHWTQWQLQMETLFGGMQDKDAIETYQVVTGLRVMTREDIRDHIFKGLAKYVPARLIEAIEVQVQLHEDTSTLDVVMAGGAL